MAVLLTFMVYDVSGMCMYCVNVLELKLICSTYGYLPLCLYPILCLYKE